MAKEFRGIDKFLGERIYDGYPLKLIAFEPFTGNGREVRVEYPDTNYETRVNAYSLTKALSETSRSLEMGARGDYCYDGEEPDEFDNNVDAWLSGALFYLTARKDTESELIKVSINRGGFRRNTRRIIESRSTLCFSERTTFSEAYEELNNLLSGIFVPSLL